MAIADTTDVRGFRCSAHVTGCEDGMRCSSDSNDESGESSIDSSSTSFDREVAKKNGSLGGLRTACMLTKCVSVRLVGVSLDWCWICEGNNL